MIFKEKPEPPKEGDTRGYYTWCLKPLKFGGKIFWLERVKVIEQYRGSWCFYDPSSGWSIICVESRLGPHTGGGK